jgi:hypothetical protein
MRIGSLTIRPRGEGDFDGTEWPIPVPEAAGQTGTRRASGRGRGKVAAGSMVAAVTLCPSHKKSHFRRAKT